MKLSDLYTTGSVAKKFTSNSVIAGVYTRTFDELFPDINTEFDTTVLFNNGSTSEMLNNGAYGSNFTAYNLDNLLYNGEPTQKIEFLGCAIVENLPSEITAINLSRKITTRNVDYGYDWNSIKDCRFVINIVSSENIDYTDYVLFDVSQTSNIVYNFNTTYVMPYFYYKETNEQSDDSGYVHNPETLIGQGTDGNNGNRICSATFNVYSSQYNKYMTDTTEIQRTLIGDLVFAYKINGEYFLVKLPLNSPDYGYKHFCFTDNNINEYLTIGGFGDFDDGINGFLPKDDEKKGAFAFETYSSHSYRKNSNYFVTANCAIYTLNSSGLRWILSDVLTTAKEFRDNVRLGVMNKNGIVNHKEWIVGETAIQASDNPNKDTSYDNIPDRPTSTNDNDDIESVGYGYFSNAVMGTLYSLYNKLDLEKIAQWFYNQTEKIDIANNVISLKEIPFSLATLNIVPLDTDLKIGGVNVTYNNENIKVGQIVSPATTTVSVLFGEFNIPRLSGTFLDYSPYAKYELLLPFAPTPVTLPDWCVNKTVSAIFLYDIYTTACQYVIECNGERICSVSGIFGVDRPISAQNVALKDASRLSAQVATASSVLGGVMSATTGNIGGIMSGAIGGVSALSQMIMSGKQNYMYTVGANGDSSSVGLCHAVHLKITRTLSAEDSNFTHVYGRPLCRYKKLSSVTGYTKCDNVNTTGLTCSETEKQRIKQLLETGIYI